MPLVTLADTAGNALNVTANPTGDLRVALPATQLFVETWDSGTLDANKWVATNGGTGVLPAPTVGSLVMNGGTTLNSFAKLTSVPVFQPTQPGFLQLLSTLNFQFPYQTTANIFHGLGTSSATPTIAAPLIQAVGWMQQTSGLMIPQVYASGTPNPPTNWNPARQPVDSSSHKYFFYFRGDICYWCIDTQDNIVASFLTGAGGPDVNGLPLLYQVISNSGAAATLQINGVTLSDTAHSATRIADAVYGFRQQTVGSRGDAVVSLMDGNKATYSASVTGLVGVAGDIAIVNGSATKTVRITRVEFSGVATAAADMDVSLIKRSTADTAGTGMTATPYDSANAAATAVAQSYTAAPTPGTTVGTPLRVVKAQIGTTAAQAQVITWDLGNGPKQGCVLRGVAQGLALNVGATQAGALYDISYEWTEE